MLFFVQLVAFFCFGSLTFASRPAMLVTATAAAVQSNAQSLAPCKVKSHAALLAERKQIFDYLSHSHVNGDCAQIIASYCATPQQWKLARELRLPGVSRVKSIAEYAPDKIAVSYNGCYEPNNHKKLVCIGDVRAGGQVNADWKVSSQLQDSWFVSTGKNNIVGAAFDGGSRLAFINVENGNERIVKPGQEYLMNAVTSFPDALCVVVIDSVVYVIKDWTEENKLVVDDLGAMPRLNEASLEQPRAGQAFCGSLIVGPNASITALNSLPGNRLVVGDDRGFVRVVNADKTQGGPFKAGDKIEAIMSLTDDVLAIMTHVPAGKALWNGHMADSWKSCIECWDIKNKRSLGQLFKDTDFSYAAALPDNRIAMHLYSTGKPSAKLSMYTIEILKEGNEPTGVKAHLEQEISFEDDPISNWSIGRHVPVFLHRASRPTMALGTQSGAVKIFEEAECEQCCGSKKANNEVAPSAK